MYTQQEIKLRLIELIYNDNNPQYYSLFPQHAIQKAKVLYEWVNENTTMPAEQIQMVLSKLDLLTKQNHEIMTKQETLNAIFGDLNTTTNEMADVISNNIQKDYEKLLAEVQSGTVSDESLAAGRENVERLKLMTEQLKTIGSQVPNDLVVEGPVVDETNGGVVNTGGGSSDTTNTNA